MGRFTPIAQVPRYMHQFQCVGSSCPENCCTGWRVAVDKPTFQRYQTVKIEPLASLIKQHVRRGVIPNAHAGIDLKREQPCHFLDSERLCQIQSQLGSDALSETCNNYPRAYAQAGEQLQMVANLSCPEAARLALASPEAMDMLPLALPYANAQLVPVTTVRPATNAQETDLVKRHAALLHEVVEAALRWPHFNASQALIYAGLILRRVANLCAETALPKEAGPEALAQADMGMAEVLGRYLDPNALAQASRSAKDLKTPCRQQVSILLQTTQQFIVQHGMRANFRQMFDEVKQGLALTPEVAEAAESKDGGDLLGEVTARYEAARADYFDPVDQAHPHLLKNYLLNDLARSLFPRRGTATLEADFMSLALRYAMIRCCLIGLAAAQKEAFTAEQFPRVVYLVARNVEHSADLIPKLLQTLKDQDLLRLELLATLVN